MKAIRCVSSRSPNKACNGRAGEFRLSRDGSEGAAGNCYLGSTNSQDVLAIPCSICSIPVSAYPAHPWISLLDWKSTVALYFLTVVHMGRCVATPPLEVKEGALMIQLRLATVTPNSTCASYTGDKAGYFAHG